MPTLSSQRTPYTEAQRMELRSLVSLAGEIVAPFWPMRTFIHHNPLHGFEDLDFEEAVQRGRHFFGSDGYLSPSGYREYVRSGRIHERHLEAVLRPLATGEKIEVAGRVIPHLEVLGGLVVHGMTVPAVPQLDAVLNRFPHRRVIEALGERLKSVVESRDLRRTMLTAAHGDRARLAQDLTLSDWCDRTFGTRIEEFIN